MMEVRATSIAAKLVASTDIFIGLTPSSPRRYMWTSEGWLYLVVILELHSRRVVGWAVNDRMKKDQAIWALAMAVGLRQPPEGY